MQFVTKYRQNDLKRRKKSRFVATRVKKEIQKKSRYKTGSLILLKLLYLFSSRCSAYLRSSLTNLILPNMYAKIEIARSRQIGMAKAA